MLHIIPQSSNTLDFSEPEVVTIHSGIVMSWLLLPPHFLASRKVMQKSKWTVFFLPTGILFFK